MVKALTAAVIVLALFASAMAEEDSEMAQTYERVPALTAGEAGARIDAYLTETDLRSRQSLAGIGPENAAAPVLAALATPGSGGNRMFLLATLADAFRVHEAGPLFLRHAAVAHGSFDGYLARIAAVRGAATTAASPAQVPEAGHRILVSLTAAHEAARALPELLLAFVAYAPAMDLTALEHRLPAIVSTLDAAGRTDDGARLAARGVEDFGLNDIPRARMAVDIMEAIRQTTPVETQLDALAAIHIGEDLRFREHLAPFAIRLLQDAALAGGAESVAAAFLRAHARAAGEADKNDRRTRQAIAAQAAAYFGTELNEQLADSAAAMPPLDAGFFGTDLVPVRH
ncbi:MAG: hypothetical protein GY850_23825 [bacterium]|nr:hypothetical protein [bacterium]